MVLLPRTVHQPPPLGAERGPVEPVGSRYGGFHPRGDGAQAQGHTPFTPQRWSLHLVGVAAVKVTGQAPRMKHPPEQLRRWECLQSGSECPLSPVMGGCPGGLHAIRTPFMANTRLDLYFVFTALHGQGLSVFFRSPLYSNSSLLLSWSPLYSNTSLLLSYSPLYSNSSPSIVTAPSNIIVGEKHGNPLQYS